MLNPHSQYFVDQLTEKFQLQCATGELEYSAKAVVVDGTDWFEWDFELVTTQNTWQVHTRDLHLGKACRELAEAMIGQFREILNSQDLPFQGPMQ